MDSTTLAQRFNEVSDQLQARGHRVIVRRLRAFLEAGDSAGAEMFLVRAKESLGAHDGGVGELAAGLSAFGAAGGEPSRLVTEPAWVEGTVREGRLSRLVEGAVASGEMGLLVERLAQHQRALASGRPLASAPSRQIEPGALPPLPRAAGGEGEGRAELGSIFRPQRPRVAVVESAPALESKPLDLDEPEIVALPEPAPPRPVVEIPEVEAPAAPAAPLRLRAMEDSPAVEPLAVPEAPAAEARGRRASLDFMPPGEMPELKAPPEMPVNTPPAAPRRKMGVGVALGLLLVVAAAAAAGWYFLR